MRHLLTISISPKMSISSNISTHEYPPITWYRYNHYKLCNSDYTVCAGAQCPRTEIKMAAIVGLPAEAHYVPVMRTGDRGPSYLFIFVYIIYESMMKGEEEKYALYKFEYCS